MRARWSIALLALLIACAAGWHKPGATAEDLEADRAACFEESGSLNMNLAASRYVDRCLRQIAEIRLAQASTT